MQSGYVIQGKTVSLPVVVRDATSMSAMFVVPAAAVRRLMPHPQLHVPELFLGRTLCVLAAIEYRDNDLGQYNEVSVAFFVKHGGTRSLPFFGLLAGFRRGAIGAYIHRLPVTTSFSCEAGRDIWGFPKTVEQITFADDGARVFAAARMPASFTLPVGLGWEEAMRRNPDHPWIAEDKTVLEIIMSTGHEPGQKARFSARSFSRMDTRGPRV